MRHQGCDASGSNIHDFQFCFCRQCKGLLDVDVSQSTKFFIMSPSGASPIIITIPNRPGRISECLTALGQRWMGSAGPVGESLRALGSSVKVQDIFHIQSNDFPHDFTLPKRPKIELSLIFAWGGLRDQCVRPKGADPLGLPP